MFCRRQFLTAIAFAGFMCAGPTLIAQQNASLPETPPQTPRDEIDILGHPAKTPDTPGTPAVAVPHDTRVPNYVTSPVAELQRALRELSHLKTAKDQSQLIPLLDKMGAKTVETAHKTPNLISHETVVSEQDRSKRRQDFSFLVLQHRVGRESIVFDEYRIDLESGQKYQTEELEKAVEAESSSSDSQRLELPPAASVAPSSSGPPKSQGFVNAWVHFYPPNRFQSEFRYLGEQQMDGHYTQVVSFAQKPGSVHLPATIAYAGKTYPLYLQGVAWVDTNDYRIVRLRTDILFPPPGVPLRQLTADIQFEEVRLAELATPLWLPRRVVVTSSVAGATLRENHTYSDYRLFRTRSKIVLQ